MVDELLRWSVRLRADGEVVAAAGRAVRRSVDEAGLVGPAGDALTDLAERVAGAVGELGRSMSAAADAMTARARCA